MRLRARCDHLPGHPSGAAGDAERTADPLPAAAGHHPAPVPGRVRSSSDSGHRCCLHGQLVSVLPSVRLDSAALKSAALPTVPEVPVRLTRPSAAAGQSRPPHGQLIPATEEGFSIKLSVLVILALAWGRVLVLTTHPAGAG